MPPLSERLRPKSFQEIIGQDHLIGENGWIQQVIFSKNPLSCLLFGPPGSGKTTIAMLYAQSFSIPFQTFSAVFSGIADIKKIIEKTKKTPLFHQKILLFVDEIHRFNKAQQDAFLPYIENGTIVLIGATTENPSFSLNNALLSRLTVLTLDPLSFDDLKKILHRYEEKIKPLSWKKEEKNYLLHLANGDGRYLLNMLETIENYQKPINLKTLQHLLQKKSPLYDKQGDQHFNIISALHKSIRGSDPDAAIYWFCRMIEGGEDPLYIARRLLRIASEDIGLADTNALQITIHAQRAYQILGSPEGELALAEAVIYLALAPKSNALYVAYQKAAKSAQTTSHLPPPLHILNAPTLTMKKLGYGKGYIYDHDKELAFSGQNYFPKKMQREIFYVPKKRGLEREMKKRIDYFSALREKIAKDPSNN